MNVKTNVKATAAVPITRAGRRGSACPLAPPPCYTIQAGPEQPADHSTRPEREGPMNSYKRILRARLIITSWFLVPTLLRGNTSSIFFDAVAVLLCCACILLSGCDSFSNSEDPVPEGLTGKIVFASGIGDSDSNIFIMNADGSELTRLTSQGLGDDPDLSPDKSKIVFEAYRYTGRPGRGGGAGIFVINSDGTGERPILGGTESACFLVVCNWSEPDWSPDGSKIAYTRIGSDPIHVMNADGTEATRITDISGGDPTWSPDGSKIAFWSVVDGNFEIFVVNVDGSGLTNLTKSSADESDPAWSPDGSKIAYLGHEDSGPLYIFVMNADGTNQTRLTNGLDAGALTWSPDGSKIAFTRNRHRLYVMNADGTGVTRIRVTAKVFSPDWR